MKNIILTAFLLTLFACSQKQQYDTIIRNGMVYDGNGGEPYKADIGINADTIAFIGDLSKATGKTETDAKGQAVAPGFVNMLSQSDVALLHDGTSQGDIRQGVTLEVMGEGGSAGPLNARMKQEAQTGAWGDIKFAVDWNTLGEYLTGLEKKGVSCNVASFVGAAEVRDYVMGEDDRAPAPAELDSMKAQVALAMREGAMGVSTALIYPPGFFAKTDELVVLSKVASAYNGMYISHMRSEGNNLLQAVDELITIAKQANIHAEIFHLKAGGKDNWYKMDTVFKKVDSANKAGLHITADMYTYLAGATGMTAAFPPTLQDGGFGKLWQRLHDPAVRAAMKKAMTSPGNGWENLYYGAGSPEKVLLLGFRLDSLKKYNGKTLAEAARLRNSTPEETAINLIVEDSTRVEVAYFLMNEDNVKKQLAQPWVSFGSDAPSLNNTDSAFLKSSEHPRAFGNFARVLGLYARDEKVLPLQQAIYKLAKLPATNLKLQKRGELAVGNYADVVVFNPATIADHATYDKPFQYATGVEQVFVNGVQVLKDGEHTGAKPGRFIKGPGYGK